MMSTAAAWAALPLVATAAGYPERPVTVVVPYSPGGAGVTITGSSKIIDVTGEKPVEYKGKVPANSVVIPGSYAKQFPAGEFHVPCAIIIGQRKESTDLKTSLNDALRENNVTV